jgi:hypothetical protein
MNYTVSGIAVAVAPSSLKTGMWPRATSSLASSPRFFFQSCASVDLGRLLRDLDAVVRWADGRGHGFLSPFVPVKPEFTPTSQHSCQNDVY